MKIRLFVLTLVWVCFAGCASVNTSALRIGMSKDEAIAIMGKPGSVSAQSNIEYLNYTLSETIGAGTMTRPYYVRLLDGRVDAFGFSEQINRSPLIAPAGGTVARSSLPNGADGIKILAIEPATLAPGRSQTVTIRAKYSLGSADEATLSVLFNVLSATGYRPFASEVVKRGAGEVTLKAVVTPVAWGEFADFKAMLQLRENPVGPGSRMLATPLQQPIPLQN